MATAKKVKRLPKADVDAIFGAFAAANPEPKGELDYVNAFHAAGGGGAVGAGDRCRRQQGDAKRCSSCADTPEKMVGARRGDGIEEHDQDHRPVPQQGQERLRAEPEADRRVRRRGARRTREALESLPGVGRKTANVVLNIAFRQPTIAVDTHLFRVANRTGLAPGDNPLEVELSLLKVVPEQYLLHAHHWLILHGRYVCKARKPECWRCVIAEWCRFEPKTPPPKGA